MTCVPTGADGLKTVPFPVSNRTVTMSPALVRNGGNTPTQKPSVGAAGATEEEITTLGGDCVVAADGWPVEVQPAIKTATAAVVRPNRVVGRS